MAQSNGARSQKTISAVPIGMALSLAALYAVQGITGSVVMTGLPTVMREAGARLDNIGLLYLLFLPWALKFLWAPYVDRYSVARFGHRRFWILLCQGVLIACFASLAFIEPFSQTILLMSVLAIVALFAATQDISTDALAVEALPAQKRHLGGTFQVAGSYFGLTIGTGLWLFLYARLSWSLAMLVMVAFLVIFTLPALLSRKLDGEVPDAKRQQTRLLRTLRQKSVRRGMGFLLIYQLGTRLGIALIAPFLVDAAMSLETISWLKGFVGIGAALAGAIVGGVIVKQIGSRAALVLFAFIHALTFSALSVVAFSGVQDTAILAIFIIAEAIALSFCFVALYAAMIGWCSPGQAGTEMSIFQSLDAVLGIAGAVTAGIVAQHLGHGVNFAGAAIFMALAAVAAFYMAPSPTSDGENPAIQAPNGD